MTLFEQLALGLRRNARIHDKAADLAERGAEVEARFKRGDCGRCGERKATVSIDGRVILCGPCAEVGAQGIGELVRHAAEDSGMIGTDKGGPLGAFVKGFLGERKS